MSQNLELATGCVVRPALPDDAPRLVAMFERCSPQSRYARFLAPVKYFPAAHLTDVVRSSSVRRSFVIDDLDTGDLVGVGSWFRNELRTAEVGLLVEDDAQCEGLGTALLDEIATSARAGGITTLVATTVAGARHVYRMLARLGPTTITGSGTTRDLRVDLALGWD